MKWLIFIIIMIQTGYRFILDGIKNKQRKKPLPIEVSESREFDSCLQFFTNQIAQNVDYINAFEFFYCQIR